MGYSPSRSLYLCRRVCGRQLRQGSASVRDYLEVVGHQKCRTQRPAHSFHQAFHQRLPQLEAQLLIFRLVESEDRYGALYRYVWGDDNTFSSLSGFCFTFFGAVSVYPESMRVCLLAREAYGVECYASFASYERPREEPLLAGDVLPTRRSTLESTPMMPMGATLH